jgi:hypothetical protein
MDLQHHPDWAFEFQLTRAAISAHERNELLRRTDRGELMRIVPGVYLPAEAASRRSRPRIHLDLVYARQLIAPQSLLFSHASAGALWDLPRIGGWPKIVHATGDAAGGGRSSMGVSRHNVGLPMDETRIDGIRVTTLTRTVVDLARTESFECGVAAADAALAGRSTGDCRIAGGLQELASELFLAEGRGVAAARSVIAFADGAAGSPGESLSRVSIARSGLTAPELQKHFSDEFGSMYVDFFWPKSGVIGEFDGVGKYLREEWMDGRTAAQVVVDEKWREDRLRRTGLRVVRWGWDVARRPVALAHVLRAAGVT